MLMPCCRRTKPIIPTLLIVAGLGLLAWAMGFNIEPLSESAMFGVCAAAAIVCAILMISSRNPVYSALWFALVTLSVCGLFVIQSAAFLAAATIIIYAGAIIVTFVFVIMLAQQEGTAVYDHSVRQPFLAAAIGFFVLGCVLASIHRDVSTVAPIAASTINLLSQPAAEQPLATMSQLGRSLFGDYLFAVEIAGTLLLVATIGAICMAPRRAKGTL
jgi:NADH-quinone oxidoreductase subunit J